jgi:hypothetical protein
MCQGRSAYRIPAFDRDAHVNSLWRQARMKTAQTTAEAVARERGSQVVDQPGPMLLASPDDDEIAERYQQDDDGCCLRSDERRQIVVDDGQE